MEVPLLSLVLKGIRISTCTMYGIVNMQLKNRLLLDTIVIALVQKMAIIP